MAKNKNKGFSLDKGSDDEKKGTSFNISKDDSSKSSTNFELDKSSDDKTKAGTAFNVTKEGSSKDSTNFELNKSTDNAVDAGTGFNITKEAEVSPSKAKQAKQAEKVKAAEKTEKVKVAAAESKAKDKKIENSTVTPKTEKSVESKTGGGKKSGKGKYAIVAILLLLLGWFFLTGDDAEQGPDDDSVGTLVDQDNFIDDDKDGIANVDEIEMGTDPNNPDSDGDGQSDGSEQNSGSDPKDAEDTYADADGDGQNDVTDSTNGDSSDVSDATDGEQTGDVLSDDNSNISFESGDTIYNFSTNSFTIDINDSALNSLYGEISNLSLNIKIVGHTDNTGDVDFNNNLSVRRAKSVYDFLIKKGYSSSLLSFEGSGESNPIGDNNSYQGRQLNRRVELILKK